MAGFDVYPRLHNTDQSGGALGGTSTQAVTQSASGALAIDWSLGNNCVVTMQANATSVTMSNPVAGQFYSLTLVQDATGSRTWASLPSTVKFSATSYLGTTVGSAPTLTTTASKRDSFVFFFDGTNYVQVTQLLNQ